MTTQQRERAPRTAASPDHQWADLRAPIEHFYLDLSLPIKDVITLMEEKHGLSASKKQYHDKLNQTWGVYKYDVSQPARRAQSESAEQQQPPYPLPSSELDIDPGFATEAAPADSIHNQQLCLQGTQIADYGQRSKPRTMVTGTSQQVYPDLDFSRNYEIASASPIVSYPTIVGPEGYGPSFSGLYDAGRLWSPESLGLPVTQPVSSEALLELNELSWTQRVFSTSDLSETRSMIHFFSNACSYPDAFNAGRLVTLQTEGCSGNRGLSPDLRQAALILVKNASHSQNCKHVRRFLKRVMESNTTYVSSKTLEMSVLHSYICSNIKRYEDVRGAMDHCALALSQYQSQMHPEKVDCQSLVVIKNTDLGAQSNINYDIDDTWNRYLNSRNAGAIAAIGNTVGNLLAWFCNIFDDNSFSRLFQDYGDEAWTKAPNSEELSDFESRVLFCYAFYRKKLEMSNLSSSAPNPTRCHELFSLQEQCGMEPSAALATISVMIMNLNFRHPGSPQKDNLVARVRSRLVIITTHRQDACLFPKNWWEQSNLLAVEFLTTYTFQQTRSRRASPGEYNIITRAFIRKFAAKFFAVNLSQYAITALGLTVKKRPSLSF